MLKPFSSVAAARTREFFAASNYNETEIRKLSSSGIPPVMFGDPENGPYKDVLAGTSAFDCLTKWFFLGKSVARAVAISAIPAWFLSLAETRGLLAVDDEEIKPQVLLTPCEDLWIASDLHQQRQSAEKEDHILPLNRPARHLCHFLIRRPVKTALDLCSGNALHATLLRGYCGRVAATDLSPRAEIFCQFNAAFNDRSPIESLCGDQLEPARGRRFDLIVCNPPFVVTPAGESKFQANALELDDFCRGLIRAIPEHLEEGGFCQMLCEWVQLPGQSWQDRLGEWVSDIGCDAWILLANTQFPDKYTRTRSRDAGLSEAQQEAREHVWIQYFKQQQVRAIHGGVIILRRRTADANWTRFDELESNVTESVGDVILQCFAAEDFLRENVTEAQMLAYVPRVSPAARLEQELAWSNEADGWAPRSVVLKCAHGLTAPLRIDATISDFVSLCQGKVSLADIVNAFAASINAPADAVKISCMGVVRELIKRGILLP